MSQPIYIGPYTKGLENNVTPFNIDNVAFPQLINAYQWRDRVRRKRGTSFLTRLTRFFNSANSSYGSVSSFNLVNGEGNLLTAFALQSEGSIVPSSVIFTDATAGNTYTEDGSGILTGVPAGTGTINYNDGSFEIVGGNGNLINTVSFRYTPNLPVMGLPHFFPIPNIYPTHLGFDTIYAYGISNAFPYPTHDISFYKNPPISANLPGYSPKTNISPLRWNGENYQQFWTVNYEGALWVTNGIKVPFNPDNIGMQFRNVSSITINQTGPSPPANVTFTINNHGLEIGDFLFFNEFSSTVVQGLNFQTGYVVAVPSANTIDVEFPLATITGVGGATAMGIAQYLTNNADDTLDCIRWYDGDPTDGNSTNPGLNNRLGWVNFCPPLSIQSFSISQSPEAQYYLAGARLIFAFKDRLLFFGPVIQTSNANSQIYLQDTVIYSQNGTPYYTVSFTSSPIDDPIISTTTFQSLLVPSNKTATPSAWFEDATGFGGFLSAGVEDEIINVASNEDVLLVGFQNMTTRLVYSGNDIVPFNFFITNSEFGTTSSFSSIELDMGVLSRGIRGFIISTQVAAQRFDLTIPDEVFQIRGPENGNERFTSGRDFINEWVYFTYPVNNEGSSDFNNQTLQYNYRDQSWGIFKESYTHYGQFYILSGYVWENIFLKYPTWEDWTDPWNSGTSSLLQPQVSAGNQQGFILLREKGVGEGNSLYIQDIVGETITSPNHSLNDGDYIIISEALGTVGDIVNNNIYSVQNSLEDTFIINGAPGTVPTGGETYLGLGVIKRMYVPFIQTKQFPLGWNGGRKSRIGPLYLLFGTTDDSVVTVNIYLSQNGNPFSPYNPLPIYPDPNAENDSLISTSQVRTSPDYYTEECFKIPLGVLGNGIDTTLILNVMNQFSFSSPIIPFSVEIIIGDIATFSDDGLGGFTVTGTGVSAGSSINYLTGVIELVFSSAPNAENSNITMNYRQNNLQSPTSIQQAQIWHRLNTSLIGDTVQVGVTLSDEQMRDVNKTNQFAEIDLHGMVIYLGIGSFLA